LIITLKGSADLYSFFVTVDRNSLSTICPKWLPLPKMEHEEVNNKQTINQKNFLMQDEQGPSQFFSQLALTLSNLMHGIV